MHSSAGRFVESVQACVVCADYVAECKGRQVFIRLRMGTLAHVGVGTLAHVGVHVGLCTGEM